MMPKMSLECIKMAIWVSWSNFKVAADHLPGFHIWDHSGVLMAKINIGTHRNTFLGVFLYVESIYDVYFGNRGRLDVNLTDPSEI